MTEISKRAMAAIDKLYYTPSERASVVYNLLNDVRNHLKRSGDTDIPTDWDILCFCVEFIGLQSIALQADDFRDLVVPVSRWVYATHYTNPGRIYGEPDRHRAEEDEHEVVHQEGKPVPRSNGSGNLFRGVEGYEGNEPPPRDS